MYFCLLDIFYLEARIIHNTQYRVLLSLIIDLGKFAIIVFMIIITNSNLQAHHLIEIQTKHVINVAILSVMNTEDKKLPKKATYLSYLKPAEMTILSSTRT